MKPAPFTMHRPHSVDQALAVLAEAVAAGREAKVIAGGQSLVPMMNFRLSRPDDLIDLSGIAELQGLETADDGHLRIGAMVSQRRALESAPVADSHPPLIAALGHIGHGHIRNRGTIGGSVAHADPAAELPTVLAALDASFEIAGPGGRRTVDAARFFQGWFTTAVDEDELLTAVIVPPMPAGPGTTVEWGFEELSRRHGDYALVLAATTLTRSAEGAIGRARVVVGGVAATPLRIEGAESALQGSTGDAAFGEAAALARAASEPADDVHGDRLYRQELVEVLVSRALRSARPGPTDPSSATGPDGSDLSSSSQVPARAGAEVAVTVTVNGQHRPLDDAPDRMLLADWLRDRCDLTGTHLGCEHGVCGACTVLLDGDPVRSCLMFANQAADHDVTTIEALGTPDRLHPVQEAFRTHHGLQCGFCTPGMVLAAVDLLARNPDPTEDQIRAELSGNICRCTGYVKIVEAVRAASAATANQAP